MHKRLNTELLTISLFWMWSEKRQCAPSTHFAKKCDRLCIPCPACKFAVSTHSFLPGSPSTFFFFFLFSISSAASLSIKTMRNHIFCAGFLKTKGLTHEDKKHRPKHSCCHYIMSRQCCDLRRLLWRLNCSFLTCFIFAFPVGGPLERPSGELSVILALLASVFVHVGPSEGVMQLSNTWWMGQDRSQLRGLSMMSYLA